MTPPSRPRATPPVAAATALLLIGAIASAVAAPTPRARTESTLPVELRNFDPAAFARLTQDQRFDFIIKALWWRDQQLQNFAYEVTHHIDQYPIRPGEPFDPQYVIKRQDAPRGLKRKGAQYLFFGEEFGRAFRARWDGSVYRSLSTDTQTNRRTATLRDEEFSGVQHLEFNHLFGFRSFGVHVVRRGNIDSKPAVLPEVLEHFRKQKQPFDIETLAEGGTTLIRLRTLEGERSHTHYWFDPARDYLPVRYHSRHVPDKHGPRWTDYEGMLAVNLNTHDVAEAQQAAGLWVPKKIVTLYRLRSDPKNDNNVETKRTYTVLSFARGGVTDEDLRVPFPAGTEVVDVVAGASYVLGEGGKAEPRPLFDTAVGKARTATEAELADALAANPPDDVLDPASPARVAALGKLADAREARLREADPLRGRPAPPFPPEAAWINPGEAGAGNGKPLRWDDLKGKVVVLDFFAEWCAPCRNDLPLANRLHEGRDRTGVVIVGVHTAGSDRAKIDKFVAEFKLAYPIVIDTPAAAPQQAGEAQPDGVVGGFGTVCAAFGVQGIPHAVVIDRKGNVAARGTLHDAWMRALELASDGKP